MNNFKVGDVVILSSGGPRMTIFSINEDKIYCFWFFYNEEVCNGPFTYEFNSAMLKRVEL